MGKIKRVCYNEMLVPNVNSAEKYCYAIIPEHLVKVLHEELDIEAITIPEKEYFSAVEQYSSGRSFTRLIPKEN